MNRVDRFVELIARPAPALAPDRSAELVQPLRDLAQALADRGQVGACVETSQDGWRHHLALWPLHRPAYRSLMATVHVANGRGTVLVSPPFSFTSADQLTEWLERFVQHPEFRDSLAGLREASAEPVDARLERGNGMATLVEVPASRQAALAQLAEGAELLFELELEDREPPPKSDEIRLLDSAGVRFDVVPGSAAVSGRKVRFRGVRRA